MDSILFWSSIFSLTLCFVYFVKNYISVQRKYDLKKRQIQQICTVLYQEGIIRIGEIITLFATGFAFFPLITLFLFYALGITTIMISINQVESSVYILAFFCSTIMLGKYILAIIFRDFFSGEVEKQSIMLNGDAKRAIEKILKK